MPFVVVITVRHQISRRREDAAVARPGQPGDPIVGDGPYASCISFRNTDVARGPLVEHDDDLDVALVTLPDDGRQGTTQKLRPVACRHDDGYRGIHRQRMQELIGVAV